METYFAPAGRNNNENILSSNQFIINETNIGLLLDLLPGKIMILDEKRQIVFLNKAICEMLSIQPHLGLGKRPGELINCIFSSVMEDGCGTSQNCKFCGAVNSILESQKKGVSVTKDCRITSHSNDILISQEYSINSAPIQIGEWTFTLFTIEDISQAKRKEVLERIFFHDLINSAGTLTNLLSLCNSNINNENKEKLLNLSVTISHEIIEDIQTQRQLLEAENRTLKVNFELINSLEITKDIVERFKHHSLSKNREIIIDSQSSDENFTTDPSLLRRVLINMLKNALESTDMSEKITIGVNSDSNHITFYVHNDTVIEPEVQLQIFQRSFSTKGKDRGIGTYSMKLLGESYLKAKVYFSSKENEGTSFYCELPLVK